MQIIELFQKSPKVLWIIWFIWTVLISYLMLAPDEGTGVDTVSTFFGASEITDAMGHSVLLFVESMLSFRLLSAYTGVERAKIFGFCMLITFAICLEALQGFVPSRGVSLLDYLANVLGVLIFFLLLTSLVGQLHID